MERDGVGCGQRTAPSLPYPFGSNLDSAAQKAITFTARSPSQARRASPICERSTVNMRTTENLMSEKHLKNHVLSPSPSTCSSLYVEGAATVCTHTIVPNDTGITYTKRSNNCYLLTT